MKGRIDELRVRGYHKQIVAALLAHEYNVLEQEAETSNPNLRYATVLRKGWMFVGTIAPLGDFGSAELVLHGHNNCVEAMAAVVVALAAGN